MPNHVTNHLTVEGPTALVEEFAVRAGQGDPDCEDEREFSFYAFVPYPEGQDRAMCGHVHNYRSYTEEDLKCWYPWNCTFWGTKWGPYNISVESDDHAPDLVRLARAADNLPPQKRVIYKFDTAWSPPVPVIDAIHKQYPGLKLTHEWACEGGQTQGRRILNGDSVSEVDYENNDEDPAWIEMATRLHGCDPRYCEECEDSYSYCTCGVGAKAGVA